MHNSDTMGIAYSLECQVSFGRSFRVHFRHDMRICEIGEVIHENSGTYVPFGSGSTTMRRKNPGVGLTNCSTLTTWPGTVSILSLLRFLTPFLCHGLWCALPYAQPRHVGESTFANSQGIKPDQAISLRMEKLRCLKCSWITARLCCLQWTKATAWSSSISLSLMGGKVKYDSIGDAGLGEKSSMLKVMVVGSLRFSLVLALRSLYFSSLSGSLVCSIMGSLVF